MKLPVPDEPYPDWSRFITAVWNHGMSVKNCNPTFLKEHAEAARKSIVSSMTERNEARTVRPSAFLGCARQTYYAANGYKADPMPDNIGTTFAVGHMRHELSYAAFKSALPEGFSGEVEKEVELPSWWPKDDERFNQKGHVDLLFHVETEEAEKYLSYIAPKDMLVDLKTMGGYSFKQHAKKDFGEDPDGFGYMAQLAVYADSLGVLENGALLAGINRDSLTQPLRPRLVSGEVLHWEMSRVKGALDEAVGGNDPGPEFLERHGKAAYFLCGRGGRPGYCAFKDICKEMCDD